MNFRLYYSNNTTTYDPGSSNPSTPALSDPPTIASVEAASEAGGVAFRVRVVGNPAAGTQGTWVTFSDSSANPGTWSSLDLQQDAAGGASKSETPRPDAPAAKPDKEKKTPPAEVSPPANEGAPHEGGPSLGTTEHHPIVPKDS